MDPLPDWFGPNWRTSDRRKRVAERLRLLEAVAEKAAALHVYVRTSRIAGGRGLAEGQEVELRIALEDLAALARAEQGEGGA